MYRCKLVVFVLAVFLTACGGSGGDSSSEIESDSFNEASGAGETPVQDDDSNVIPVGNDDIGTIPDIGEDTDLVDESVANENSDEVVIDTSDPSTEMSGDPADDEPVSMGADETALPSGLNNGSTARVARWRAALAQEPSADATNRETLLETLFELSRYDFVFELADKVYEVEQRILNEDGFEALNVSVNGFSRTHLCSERGRVLSTDRSENGLHVRRYRFENCAFGKQEISGGFEINESLSRNGLIVNTGIISALTIIDDSEFFALSGSILQLVSTDIDDSSFSSVGSFTYSEGGSGDLVIDELDLDSLDFLSVRYNTHTHTYVNPEFNTVSDTGFSVRNRFEVNIGEDLPEWSVIDFSVQGLRGETPGSVVIGQLTLDTSSSDRAQLVLQADNGDPNSFDLIGFTDDDTVGSAVYEWGGNLRFGTPRLYSQSRAIQVLEN